MTKLSSKQSQALAILHILSVFARRAPKSLLGSKMDWRSAARFVAPAGELLGGHECVSLRPEYAEIAEVAYEMALLENPNYRSQTRDELIRDVLVAGCY